MAKIMVNGEWKKLDDEYNNSRTLLNFKSNFTRAEIDIILQGLNLLSKDNSIEECDRDIASLLSVRLKKEYIDRTKQN